MMAYKCSLRKASYVSVATARFAQGMKGENASGAREEYGSRPSPATPNEGDISTLWMSTQYRYSRPLFDTSPSMLFWAYIQENHVMTSSEGSTLP